MSLEELKQLCLDKKIPIVRDQTLVIIVDLINKNNYKSLLELGTAYGYSSYAFITKSNLEHITTIELNHENYLIAKNNLSSLKKVECVNTNAFDFIPKQKYDVIFLDACKSKQEILFSKYKEYLNPNGVIIIDNLFLKKFDQLPTLTKNQKKLKEKVNQFYIWLTNLKDWKVIIKDIDDGLAICSLKNENYC
ncbi:MAG: methyltransferase [Mycoplasma sp.]